MKIKWSKQQLRMLRNRWINTKEHIEEAMEQYNLESDDSIETLLKSVKRIIKKVENDLSKSNR